MSEKEFVEYNKESFLSSFNEMYDFIENHIEDHTDGKLSRIDIFSLTEVLAAAMNIHHYDFVKKIAKYSQEMKIK